MNSVNIRMDRSKRVTSHLCLGGEIFTLKKFGGYYMLGYSRHGNRKCWYFMNLASGIIRDVSPFGPDNRLRHFNDGIWVYSNDILNFSKNGGIGDTLVYLGNSFKMELSNAG